MSIGMSTAWRAKQPKLKRCKRCELYFPEKSDKCIHCSDLNESQLIKLKAQHQEILQGNSEFGKYLFFAAIIIGLFLVLSFL